jgi:hypothetical protein
MINPKWLNIAGLVLNIAGTWDQVIDPCERPLVSMSSRRSVARVLRVNGRRRA